MSVTSLTASLCTVGGVLLLLLCALLLSPPFRRALINGCIFPAGSVKAVAMQVMCCNGPLEVVAADACSASLLLLLCLYLWVHPATISTLVAFPAIRSTARSS